MAPSTVGRIEVVVGCMFSGKTEELIRRLRRSLYAKQRVVAVKPVIDNRYTAEDLATHAGYTLKAFPVKNADEILKRTADAEVVGIDEAQFIEGLSEAVQDLARAGKRVIVSGLDLDYRGVPFGPIPYLMAVADRVEKLTAICMVCGGDATRSQRIVDSEEQIVIGGENVYEPRCRVHWSPKPVFSEDRQMDRRED